MVVRFSEEDNATIWDMREAGVPVKRIAKHLGRQNSSLRKFISDAGGRRPSPGGGQKPQDSDTRRAATWGSMVSTPNGVRTRVSTLRER